MNRDMTVTVDQDGDMLISHCIDLDVASQGYSEEESLDNLKEAVALFLETASKKEIQSRLNRPRRMNFDLA